MKFRKGFYVLEMVLTVALWMYWILIKCPLYLIFIIFILKTSFISKIAKLWQGVIKVLQRIIIRVFCPRAGPSLQAQEPGLQFCRRNGRLASWHKWKSCEVGEAKEGLGNELWRRWNNGSSFPNPSLALPTSQLILQRFRCFTYVTAHSPTFLSLLLPHRIFTYVTWRAAHGRRQVFHRKLRNQGSVLPGMIRCSSFP